MLSACSLIVGIVTGAVLDDAYYEQAVPTVDLRIAQAGVRLAAILNLLFSQL